MRSMNAMHKTSNERKIEEKTDQEIAKKNIEPPRTLI